jgi:hypothetical protein
VRMLIHGFSTSGYLQCCMSLSSMPNNPIEARPQGVQSATSLNARIEATAFRADAVGRPWLCPEPAPRAIRDRAWRCVMDGGGVSCLGSDCGAFSDRERLAWAPMPRCRSAAPDAGRMGCRQVRHAMAAKTRHAPAMAPPKTEQSLHAVVVVELVGRVSLPNV